MGHAFDPELAAVVELIPMGDFSDVVAAREQLIGMLAPFNDGVDTTGVTVTDDTVDTDDGPVAVRVYAPHAPPPAGGRPALLDIHGGGFAVGSIEMEHAFATHLARDVGAVVVTPEYRLAPEHPYPAGLDDCAATLAWMHERADALGVDRTRVAVGGQSAGGGLAAALALRARDDGGPSICFQFLGIPELDHRLGTASMRAFVDTPMWNLASAERSWAYYLGPDITEVSPYASPAIAEDLRGLPPAYVTTMEFDPLRDEGITYAMRMMDAGVSVELHSYPGTFHGSALVTTAVVSRRADAELTEVLRRALGTAG